MAISQYPAGSQGTPGEYGNFTRHSVENAALYKARAVGNHTTKLGACKALRERRYILSPVSLAQRAPLQAQSVLPMLTAAGSYRQHCAGRGLPLPYNISTRL